MSGKIFYILLLFNYFLFAFNAAQDCAPKQVRLYLGDQYESSYPQPILTNTAKVAFHTMQPCTDSKVVVQINNQIVQFTNKDIIHSKWTGQQFCQENSNCENVYYDQYIHTVYLNIQTGIYFSYTVYGDIMNTVGPFQSILPDLNFEQNDQKNQLEFLVFGDIDQSDQGNITLNRFESNIKNSSWNFTSLIFLGDYAYEFYQDNGTKGDQFMSRLQYLFTKWPLMIGAGNHEDNQNFSFFNEKFQMPSFDQNQNNYYSYNVGPIHFIQLNLWYFYDGVKVPDENQQQIMLQWTENDLIQSNQYRDQRPWIIITGHVPIYCLGSKCSSYYDWYKQFDELFKKYKVDLFLGGHRHEYQQLKPLYQNQLQSYDTSQGQHHIVNPQSYVQVICGNGGNDSMDKAKSQQELNSTQQNDENMLAEYQQSGYCQLTVFNQTTLQVTAFDSQTGEEFNHYYLVTDHEQTIIIYIIIIFIFLQ